MTLRHLLGRNLTFHWRGNLAVLCGVIVGTAALTGALLVGDSLRGSLRARVVKQLGWIDEALMGGRLFAERHRSLSKGDPFWPLSNYFIGRVGWTNTSLATPSVVQALLMRGTASTVSKPGDSANKTVARTKVTIAGVEGFFWDDSQSDATAFWNSFWNSAEPAVVLSASLGHELGVKRGDTIILQVPKANEVPRESLLGRRDSTDVLADLRLSVAEVLPEDHFGSRFNLSSGLGQPRNAFVPLHALQASLRLNGRINTLFATRHPYLLSPDGDPLIENLNQALSYVLTMDDWGLVLHSPNSRASNLLSKIDRNGDGKLERKEWRNQLADSLVQGADEDRDSILTNDEVTDYYRRHRSYMSLESRQMLLESAAVSAAEAAAKKLNLQSARTLVYLANRIVHGKQSIPYSIVAALDPSLPPPLGLPGQPQLKDDEILLADWKDSPIHAKPDDSIQLTYFQPEEQGRLTERTETFRFAGLVPMQGSAADPDLTPEFPGITDKLTIGEWNPPFPYNGKLIQDRDERYWRQFRTTPKAYVTLATGQRLWGSRFGNLTSIRFGAPAGKDLATVATEFRIALLSELRPEQGGFVFEPIRERMLQASSGGTDFGGLFLGFSFFLIVAALLLVGLLFRLNLDRRAGEIGLLFAVGYSYKTVRRLLVVEGAVLAVTGAFLGCLLALAYAWLLLDLLAAWWPGTLDRSFLRLHVLGASLPIGFFASVLVSVLTIIWAVRILGRINPSVLVSSGGFVDTESPGVERPGRWSAITSAVAGLLGVALVCCGSFDRRLAANHEVLASLFFTGGFLLLFAGLLGVWAWMKRQRAVASHRVIRPSSFAPRPLAVLGVRNATRYPLRSLLTAGLLASAAFVIVAVDSFRRRADETFNAKTGGSGGFALVAESDVPVFQDMNTDKGQDELNFSDASRKELEGTTIVQMRLRKGDDASCLNLYQPNRPRVVGVPQMLIERGGFSFQATEAHTKDLKENPWRLLNELLDDGTIPAFGEANTVQWMLKSGLAKTVEIKNERGEPVRLRIVGLLHDSVFQSELLVSEANFLRLYPGQEGYNYFLIETPTGRWSAVAKVLEDALAQRGMVVTGSIARLSEYLAVENTYLSTFQALGGLGLLLGALGLAVVLLRSVWERRAELALLRALGYRNSAIGWLILAENGFLLVLGLVIGTTSALVSVLPRLYEGRLHDNAGSLSIPMLIVASRPIARIMAFLAGVLLVGLLAGVVAVITTLRAPLLPALRRE